MATAKEQLLSMMNPQQARLLDQQMREQQVAQRSQGAGMLSGLVQAYTGMGDTLQRAAGITPMGANELGAIENNKQVELQKQRLLEEKQDLLDKKQKELVSLKQQARDVIMANPDLGEQAASNLMLAIDKDETGKLSSEVLKKYLPAIKGTKVAGNNVFDERTGEWITAPTSSKGSKTTPKVNFKTASGLDPKNFTKESWLAASKAFMDPNTPLADRLAKANNALTIKEGAKLSEPLQEYVIGQLENYDVKGMNNKLNVIDEQIRLVNSGDLISGFGAPALKTIASIGQRFGILTPDQANALSTTETFEANAGNLVAEVIKAFGAGTGLSDADREYATKIAAGSINLDEVSIKRILEITQRAAIAEAENYNKKLAVLGDDWVGTSAIEVPRFRRLDMSDPFLQRVIMKDGSIAYLDTNPEGYTNEAYDANGYLLK